MRGKKEDRRRKERRLVSSRTSDTSTCTSFSPRGEDTVKTNDNSEDAIKSGQNSKLPADPDGGNSEPLWQRGKGLLRKGAKMAKEKLKEKQQLFCDAYRGEGAFAEQQSESAKRPFPAFPTKEEAFAQAQRAIANGRSQGSFPVPTADEFQRAMQDIIANHTENSGKGEIAKSKPPQQSPKGPLHAPSNATGRNVVQGSLSTEVLVVGQQNIKGGSGEQHFPVVAQTPFSAGSDLSNDAVLEPPLRNLHSNDAVEKSRTAEALAEDTIKTQGKAEVAVKSGSDHELGFEEDEESFHSARSRSCSIDSTDDGQNDGQISNVGAQPTTPDCDRDNNRECFKSARSKMPDSEEKSYGAFEGAVVLSPGVHSALGEKFNAVDGNQTFPSSFDSSAANDSPKDTFSPATNSTNRPAKGTDDVGTDGRTMQEKPGALAFPHRKIYKVNREKLRKSRPRPLQLSPSTPEDTEKGEIAQSKRLQHAPSNATESNAVQGSPSPQALAVGQQIGEGSPAVSTSAEPTKQVMFRLPEKQKEEGHASPRGAEDASMNKSPSVRDGKSVNSLAYSLDTTRCGGYVSSLSGESQQSTKSDSFLHGNEECQHEKLFGEDISSSTSSGKPCKPSGGTPVDFVFIGPSSQPELDLSATEEAEDSRASGSLDVDQMTHQDEQAECRRAKRPVTDSDGGADGGTTQKNLSATRYLGFFIPPKPRSLDNLIPLGIPLGIPNSDKATCYIISLFQCFRLQICQLDGSHPDNSLEAELANSFCGVEAALLVRSLQKEKLVAVKRKVFEFGTFKGKQQDVTEVAQLLLEGLICLGAPGIGFTVVDETKQCKLCFHKTHSHDVHRILPVQLYGDGHSVESLIRLALNPPSEDLATVSMICDLCGENTNSQPHRVTKAFQAVPDVFPISFARFLGATTKNETPVIFPDSNQVEVDLPDREGKLSKVPYKIAAIIVHHGLSTSQGHYTAFVDYGKSGWFYFDDLNVLRVGDYQGLLACLQGPRFSGGVYMVLLQKLEKEVGVSLPAEEPVFADEMIQPVAVGAEEISAAGPCGEVFKNRPVAEAAEQTGKGDPTSGALEELSNFKDLGLNDLPMESSSTPAAPREEFPPKEDTKAPAAPKEAEIADLATNNYQISKTLAFPDAPASPQAEGATEPAECIEAPASPMEVEANSPDDNKISSPKTPALPDGPTHPSGSNTGSTDGEEYYEAKSIGVTHASVSGCTRRRPEEFETNSSDRPHKKSRNSEVFPRILQHSNTKPGSTRRMPHLQIQCSPGGEPLWVPLHIFTRDNHDNDRMRLMKEYTDRTMVPMIGPDGKEKKTRKGEVVMARLCETDGWQYFEVHDFDSSDAAEESYPTTDTDDAMLDVGSGSGNQPKNRKNGFLLWARKDYLKSGERVITDEQGRRTIVQTHFVGSESEGKFCAADAATAVLIKLCPERYQAGKALQTEVREELSPEGKATPNFKLISFFEQQLDGDNKRLFDVGRLNAHFHNNKLKILSLNEGVFIITIKYWVQGNDPAKQPPPDQRHAIVWYAEPGARFFFDNTARAKVIQIEPKDTIDKPSAVKAFDHQFQYAFKVEIIDGFCISKRGETPNNLLPQLNWAWNGPGTGKGEEFLSKQMSKWDWNGEMYIKREQPNNNRRKKRGGRGKRGKKKAGNGNGD